MRQELEIPEYSRESGLHYVWEPESLISVTRSKNGVLISANRDGLISLARHLLTLAQSSVPGFVCIHLSEWTGLEPGSIEFVVEKAETEFEESENT
jgi:hypothetical protein